MRTNKSPQQQVLPADEATIQERQVTIQVLTLGTKQVTQALYRQLLEENLINSHTGLMKGIPWGWANLHIDCNDERDHLHVVWEDKGQLKRSRVHKSFQVSSYYQELHQQLRTYTQIYAAKAALEERHLSGYDNSKLYMNVNGYQYNVSLPYCIQHLWDLPDAIAKAKKLLVDNEAGVLAEGSNEKVWGVKNAIELLSDIRGKIERSKELIRETFEYKDILDEYTSALDVYSVIEDIYKELSALENNWKTSFATIKQTGQLFIAVSGVWK